MRRELNLIAITFTSSVTQKTRVRCTVTHADYFFNCHLHYRDKVGLDKSSIKLHKVIEQEYTYDTKSREVTDYVTHPLTSVLQRSGELGENLP